jgi:GTP pyrophosphokinase
VASEPASRPEVLPAPPPLDPVEQLYAELAAKMREHHAPADIEEAFRFAWQYHEGQTRDSGEPYMMHPLMVATSWRTCAWIPSPW